MSKLSNIFGSKIRKEDGFKPRMELFDDNFVSYEQSKSFYKLITIQEAYEILREKSEHISFTEEVEDAVNKIAG